MGVSTSMNPAASSRRRIADTTLDLKAKTSREAGFDSRSSARLAVGEAVVFLRQRADCLCKDRDHRNRHAQLSGTGPEDPPFDADEISEIELFEDLP
jgi:hypothetical protein